MGNETHSKYKKHIMTLRYMKQLPLQHFLNSIISVVLPVTSQVQSFGSLLNDVQRHGSVNSNDFVPVRAGLFDKLTDYSMK